MLHHLKILKFLSLPIHPFYLEINNFESFYDVTLYRFLESFLMKYFKYVQ